MTWVGTDGWQRDWPQSLGNAIRDLSGGAEVSEKDLDHLAKRLTIASDLGRMGEKPSASSASEKQTRVSLESLHDDCERLAKKIEELRRPACEALIREGADLHTLKRLLFATQQAARDCWDHIDAPASNSGAKPKLEAEAVTSEAAKIYFEVTGRKPTWSTSTSNNMISGAWPEFLKKCFSALYIQASVESQLRKLGKK